MVNEISGWWFQTWLDDFPFHTWDVILPIEEVHHFSRWKSCTTNQNLYHGLLTYQLMGYNLGILGMFWRFHESIIYFLRLSLRWFEPIWTITGWWFGTFLFFHILGMSSSQLTDFHIFQRGGSTTNRINIWEQDLARTFRIVSTVRD